MSVSADTPNEPAKITAPNALIATLLSLRLARVDIVYSRLVICAVDPANLDSHSVRVIGCGAIALTLNVSVKNDLAGKAFSENMIDFGCCIELSDSAKTSALEGLY